jgi:K319L-like, PKD domain
MPRVKRRSRMAVGALALAAAAVFVLPTSAARAQSTFGVVCTNNLVTANLSDISLTMNATASPNPVTPGGTVTLSNITGSAAIPSSVFLAGYIALGSPDGGMLIVPGVNTFPTTVQGVIEGTNTTQGTQLTNSVSTTVQTTITDPDNSVPLGLGATGDEAATPAAFNVTFANQTWTAGASGTIDFRMDTRFNAALPVDLPDATGGGDGFVNRSLRITALVGGALPATFSCTPGTSVDGTAASGAVFTDPAPSFASTLIQSAEVDDPPTANAGPDQTVDENTLVTLAGSGTDPEGETLTFNWTAPAGITLTGANTASPTFTAPDVAAPTPFTLTLQVCDEADPTQLCATDTVVVTVNPVVVEPPEGKPCPPRAGKKKKPHKPAPNSKGKKCGFNFIPDSLLAL